SPSPAHPPPPHLPSSRRLPSNLRRRRHDDEPPSPTTGNGANPAFRTPHLRTAYRKPVPPVAAAGEGEALLAVAPHSPILTFLFPIGLLADRLPRPTTPPFQRSAATVILFQTRARRRWLPPSSKRSRRWLGFAPPSSAKRPRR
ncbi:hypothetical protein EE612_027634, partial [Oryza sativa]